MEKNKIDIKENYIYHLDNELLTILLKDRSSGKNIIWATDNYSSRGTGYQGYEQITIKAITGYHGNVIKPRSEKSKKEQTDRIRDKAEVFTPSWICNKQNNLVDNAWFGTDFVFNEETEKTWIATTEPIAFPTVTGKTWQDYINDVRLEITCGEAPYLVSRYDTVSGYMIELSQRIGLLDRKLRVVSENTQTEKEWLKWAIKSFQNTYGYDWQGDNVLLARENLLFTFIDYYKVKFEKEPGIDILKKIAEILSWNIWQMDGLKFVIPESCKEVEEGQLTLFDDEVEKQPCPGCAKNDPYAHTGIYCIIKDWKANKKVTFVSLLKKD
ncbi:MAG: restriction endonuclease subunit M [Clostridia bacterium]|nr:restriction endonuclease subunit M [Clostridia bacterium]